MGGRVYSADPSPERAETLATLIRAGIVEAPRMKGEWRLGRQLAAIDGTVESTLTRREMLKSRSAEARARALEEAAAFGIDLDEQDRQWVRLPYLLPDAAESSLDQWVDRQYALGRIAPGYRLVKVEPSLNVDPFLDSEAAAKRLHVTVGTLRNYRGREWRAGEAFPEPDRVFSGVPVWHASTLDEWQANRRGHGGPRGATF